MSVNMPQLHALFSNALDPNGLHTILLLTVNGAIIISASSLPSTQKPKTTITLAAVAVETWTNVLAPPGDIANEQEQNGTSDEVQGGWATVEIGNVFVYPVVRPPKSQSRPSAAILEHDAMFLLAVCGPEDAGWELLEERAKLLATHLAPIFADYSDSMTETPAIGNTPRPVRA